MIHYLTGAVHGLGAENQDKLNAFNAELAALMERYGVDKVDVCWSISRVVAAKAAGKKPGGWLAKALGKR